jgi:hypothetical protein
MKIFQKWENATILLVINVIVLNVLLVELSVIVVRNARSFIGQIIRSHAKQREKLTYYPIIFPTYLN